MPITNRNVSVQVFNTRNDFPVVGAPNELYTINNTADLFKWDNLIGDYVELFRSDLILRSPNGSDFRLTVANDGTLTATAV